MKELKFNYGYRKFAFAIFSLLVGSFVCIYMKYEGVIFQGIFIGVTGGYLASQAIVDWKNKDENPTVKE